MPCVIRFNANCAILHAEISEWYVLLWRLQIFHKCKLVNHMTQSEARSPKTVNCNSLWNAVECSRRRWRSMCCASWTASAAKRMCIWCEQSGPACSNSRPKGFLRFPYSTLTRVIWIQIYSFQLLNYIRNNRVTNLMFHTF